MAAHIHNSHRHLLPLSNKCLIFTRLFATSRGSSGSAVSTLSNFAETTPLMVRVGWNVRGHAPALSSQPSQTTWCPSPQFVSFTSDSFKWLQSMACSVPIPQRSGCCHSPWIARSVSNEGLNLITPSLTSLPGPGQLLRQFFSDSLH